MYDNHFYPNRKDWVKPYPKKQQRCDRSCRPNGGCQYCAENRQHSTKKRELSAKEQLVE